MLTLPRGFSRTLNGRASLVCHSSGSCDMGYRVPAHAVYSVIPTAS